MQLPVGVRRTRPDIFSQGLPGAGTHAPGSACAGEFPTTAFQGMRASGDEIGHMAVSILYPRSQHVAPRRQRNIFWNSIGLDSIGLDNVPENIPRSQWYSMLPSLMQNRKCHLAMGPTAVDLPPGPSCASRRLPPGCRRIAAVYKAWKDHRKIDTFDPTCAKPSLKMDWIGLDSIV